MCQPLSLCAIAPRLQDAPPIRHVDKSSPSQTHGGFDGGRSSADPVRVAGSALRDGEASRFDRSLESRPPAVPLIIYTVHEDASTLKQALAYGVAGIVPKTHSAKLLQKAIELVIEGGVYMPPDLARQLACPEPGPSGRPQSIAMSPQQWRILELLAQGLPNKEIARTLGIASSTVKNQLTVVFERLGVSNRTQAAMAARALVKNGGERARRVPQA